MCKILIVLFDFCHFLTRRFFFANFRGKMKFAAVDPISIDI